MSSEAFQAFRCECFGDESWLRADYSLQCTTAGCPGDAGAANTPQYDEALGVAWTVIIVYAFGVPALYWLLLHRVSDVLHDGESTRLSDALSFLHNGYRPSFSQWEVANQLQKLFMVGFATLIVPGTMMQLVYVLLVVLAFELLLIFVKPYRSMEDNLLAIVEQGALLLFVVLCLIAKAESLAREAMSAAPDRAINERRIHVQFFHDTEAIADMMVCSLVAAVAFAAVFSMRMAGPDLSYSLSQWSEGFSNMRQDTIGGLGSIKAQRRAEARRRAQLLARRRAAAQRLRDALNGSAAKLEVPQFLHADESTLNPYHVVGMEQARERRRMQKMMQKRDSALSPGEASSFRASTFRCSRFKRASEFGESSFAAGENSCARCGFERRTLGLRALRLEVCEGGTKRSSGERRHHAMQRYLKREHGVASLWPERMLPDESDLLRRRVTYASKTLPIAVVDGNEARVRTSLRGRLEARGWKGAEPIEAKTRWLKAHEVRWAVHAQHEVLAEARKGSLTDSRRGGAGAAAGGGGGPSMLGTINEASSRDELGRGSCDEISRESGGRRERRSVTFAGGGGVGTARGSGVRTARGGGVGTARGGAGMPITPEAARAVIAARVSALLSERGRNGGLDEESQFAASSKMDDDESESMKSRRRAGALSEAGGGEPMAEARSKSRRDQEREEQRDVERHISRTHKTPADTLTSRPGKLSRREASGDRRSSRDSAVARPSVSASVTHASAETTPAASPRQARPEDFLFQVGQRVRHDTRGTGTVRELMDDGRTRVAFDNGETHPYHPKSIHKLKAVSASTTSRQFAKLKAAISLGGVAARLMAKPSSSSSAGKSQDDEVRI